MLSVPTAVILADCRPARQSAGPILCVCIADQIWYRDSRTGLDRKGTHTATLAYADILVSLDGLGYPQSRPIAAPESLAGQAGDPGVALLVHERNSLPGFLTNNSHTVAPATRHTSEAKW